ncbi:hypothetical protein E2562_038889 [Oryza meyeriana var. granulata]|uniref:Uncharacterized protein n=1 Tax=Oryza meyeriana var. granulata TaxID=110450 RepID=A0A6G1EUJ5_9ORYZ|nr:hypothetical protein E2562_038889 [Oryza meyeriana var. granulata]
MEGLTTRSRRLYGLQIAATRVVLPIPRLQIPIEPLPPTSLLIPAIKGRYTPTTFTHLLIIKSNSPKYLNLIILRTNGGNQVDW